MIKYTKNCFAGSVITVYIFSLIFEKSGLVGLVEQQIKMEWP